MSALLDLIASAVARSRPPGRGRGDSQGSSDDEDSSLEAGVLEASDDQSGEYEDDEEDSAEAEPPALEPPVLVDLGRALVLDDDPAVAVAINDAHRRPDAPEGPGADLWTVDQLRAAMPRQYKYVVPTFAPRHWPTPVPISQEEYSARFEAKFPEVASIGPIEHVVIAGGAAAWPFGESRVKPGDVDLFICGIDPADEKALWSTVHNVVKKLTAAFLEGVDGVPPRVRALTQTMSPGVVTITAVTSSEYGYRATGDEIKVQIILRAYPSLSAILHAFDVPSACVAYDWRRAYTTTLGAFAQVFRANVVVPAYRSTTYESRLAKYFERGYALALPGLRPGILKRGETLALPHLSLAAAVVRGRFAAGAVVLPATAAPSSDYEPRRVRLHTLPEAAEFAPRTSTSARSPPANAASS
ncbi:MAG: hypothetical protein DYH06_11265 [Acidobacteria bacterium ACB2]|nr:hypothetical protein [Acidobacteria bacterium ACB2]